MLRVEVLDQARRGGRIERCHRRLQRQLETLLGVTQIGKAHETAALGRNALAREFAVRFLLRAPARRVDGSEIVVGATLKRGAGVVVLQIGREQAERAEQARIARHQDGAAAERAAEFDAVQRTGAAERHQREILRVIAALDRNNLERAGHVGIDDADHTFGRILDADTERAGDVALDGRRAPSARRARISPSSSRRGNRPNATCASVTVALAPPRS